MRNIIILPLVVMVLTASCQNVDMRKKMQKDYKQSVQFFEKNLVSHFPLELPDSCGYSTTVPKKDTLKMFGFGVDRLFMFYSFSQYKNISTYFKSLPSNIYSANDSSLLLIFSYCDVIEIDGRMYRNQEPPERQALAKHNVITGNSLPVPLFEIDEYKGNTMSGLPEDFKIIRT